MRFVLLFIALILTTTHSNAQESSRTVKLFDGTFKGWEGDTKNTWRIEDGAIVAGSMEKAVPRNEFINTVEKFSDFELRLKFKTEGTEKINCGIQFRSERMRPKVEEDGHEKPGYSHEFIGYQADIGENVHGKLYDESRRRKFLAETDEATDKKVAAAIPEDGWQTYRIRAVGNHIQLWLNGVKTVDYKETDPSIWKKGSIALQIHGNMVGTVAYKDIVIEDLSDMSDVSIDDMAWIAGHWTGEAMGGQFEETWNPPLGGEMMGMFKLVSNGKVNFYEILTIVPKEDSFVLRLKHFSPGLKGWEEKDKSVEFPLISVSSEAVQFNGLEFRKVDDDKMVIEVVVNQGTETRKVEFHCKRTKQ